jgi:hypothetical protein
MMASLTTGPVVVVVVRPPQVRSQLQMARPTQSSEPAVLLLHEAVPVVLEKQFLGFLLRWQPR